MTRISVVIEKKIGYNEEAEGQNPQKHWGYKEERKVSST